MIKDPFKEFFRNPYLLEELVEVMDEVRRREEIRAGLCQIRPADISVV